MALVMVSDRFEHAQRTQADYVRGVRGLIKRNAHMRLRRQIIDLIGQSLFDNPA